MRQPPGFIVHDLAQARAAFAAADAARLPVRIESAPGAAGYAGAGWWAAVIAQARAEFAGVRALCVLDCGEEPGLALGAIRAGVEAIRCRARPRARARLKALAKAAGLRWVEGALGPALDLGTVADAPAAAAAHLARRARGRRGGALQKA